MPARTDIDPGESAPRPSGSDPVRPGTVVGGKFVLIKQIGRGSMGTVFEAEDTWIGRHVAIKLLHPHIAADPSTMWRFQREARAAASIQHPNIVAVLELGRRRDGTCFIVQELLTGVSLRTHLTARGRLGPREALDLLIPIMGAVVAAHRKDIIHRDIKPENIFLARSPSGEITPKLIDFGIARMALLAGELETLDGTLLGTPSYMSPEQVEGLPASPATDIWALGAVLFEVLAGSRPFLGKTAALVVERIRTAKAPPVRSVAEEIPPGLAAIVDHALERDPARRFSSTEALLRAVLELAEREDPSLASRHARSIPAYVDGSPAPANAEQLDSDLRSERDRRPPPRALVESIRTVSRPDLEWHEDRPVEAPRGQDWHAEQALSINALDDAIAYAQQAILTMRASGELLGRMQLVQAIAYRWLGNFAEAERRASEALARLPRGGAGWYAALGQLATVVGYLGKNERLEQLAAEIVGVSGQTATPAAHLRALSQVTISLIRAGRIALAERVFDSAQSITATIQHDEPGVRGWCALASAEFAMHAGDPTTFLRLVESAVESFAQAGDARNASLQRANIGNAYLQLGAFARAERVLRQAITVGEPMKLSFIAPVRANLGFALARLGRLDEALAVERDALDRCVEQGYRRFEGAARIYLAEIFSLKGELGQALTHARGALAAAAGSPALRAFALATVGGVLLRLSQPAEALGPAREAQEILESLDGVEEGEAMIRLVYVLALRAVGRDVEAAERAAEAQRRLMIRADRIGDPAWRKSFLDSVPENAMTMALFAQAPATRR